MVLITFNCEYGDFLMFMSYVFLGIPAMQWSVIEYLFMETLTQCIQKLLD
jgi:hypothetical protein